MSNNRSIRGTAARRVALEGTIADPVHAAVAEIEQANPVTVPVAPTPRTSAVTKPVTPMHTVIDGRGAMVWRKTGDHTVEAVWDPHAPALVPTPLPLGSDLSGHIHIFRLARLHNLDRLAFRAFAEEHRDLVRECGRRHRDAGQDVSWQPLIDAFKAAQQS